MCKKLIYLAAVLLMLAISVSVQADVFSDDFETARDYIAEGVQGTGWDGFVGLDPGETVDALNASIDRAGQLYLASTNAVWSGPWDPLGPYLYKIIEGDFIATVEVVDYAGTEAAVVYHNDGGLSARVPNPADAGDGEDWVAIQYFPIWNCGNFVRTANNNTRTENGHNGMTFGLDPWLQLERVGNTFHFRTSVDGLSWTEMDVSPITRDDMDGLALQVGIHHATYSENPGYIAFDHFSIEGPLVVPGFKAYNPNPAEGVVDVPRDTDLVWTPAATAVAHDVYFGTDLDNVSDASRTNPLDVLVSQGQEASTYDPADLFEFGQTYYWRVDEVEADGTLLTGSIWSFTAEPFAYPIENVTATASSSTQDQDPENTVNGSGLDVNNLDLHSTELEAMWLTAAGETEPAWIQYEFDKVCKLHQMLVWNHNGMLEPMLGFGCKDVTIEYSVNGTDYTTLGTTHEFARAPGTADYEHNTTVDFEGATAKYVRLMPNSNWGGILAQYGLSEVRFLYIPVFAREPSPDSGATDVDVDVTLGFRAGREAAKHDVYLSTDEQAVIDGTATVSTVTENSYSTSLDVDSTYYWRVDEVNDAEAPTTWQGEIWSLSTPEYLVVDDFELYNDLNPGDPESNRIFNAWIDGYDDPTNGSLVGYDNTPFAEQTIVHGGNQSMPFSYDNSTAGYAEATVNVANLQVGQDWTKGGAETLVLWLHGALSNAATGQLYVKINDTKVVYGGDLSVPIWKQWNVDFASLGINLSNITALSIGVDGGGSGMLYVDDIVLYRIAPPVLEHAVVFSDDFETPRDYVAEGAQGTGWDGFVGLDPGETVDALNASIDRAGQLYLASTNAVWSDPWDPLGPYLYKIIEGDFIATVEVVDYAGTETDVVYHNDGGLAARVPNPADAGDGEDWVAIQYFPIWGCGNFVRSADDNSRTENGNNGMAFGLDPWLQLERVGNTFHFRTSVDGSSWTEMDASPITRDDMAGLPLQVGIHHATYSENPGYIAFDNFSIESPFSVGPVGYWKLDEASGLTAADSSGYGNDGTLTNMTGTEWTAGILDGALMLNGSDQYVDCGNDSSLQLTGEVTISAWAKMEPANEDAYMGIAGKLAGGNNGYALVRHGSNVFRMWVGNIEGSALEGASSNVTYNDTDWHHVVGVVSNNTGYLYIDGVKQAEEAAVRLIDSGDYACIGRQYSDYDDRYWNGTIDDVRIYYCALSEVEISDL